MTNTEHNRHSHMFNKISISCVNLSGKDWPAVFRMAAQHQSFISSGYINCKDCGLVISSALLQVSKDRHDSNIMREVRIKV